MNIFAAVFAAFKSFLIHIGFEWKYTHPTPVSTHGKNKDTIEPSKMSGKPQRKQV